jgi:hypothetical protein
VILTFENRAERVGICADNGLDYEGQAGTSSGGTQATLTHSKEPEKADNKLIKRAQEHETSWHINAARNEKDVRVNLRIYHRCSAKKELLKK